MTALAPTLQAFFTDRLIRQRHASPHTIAAYRDTLRLLLGFAATSDRQRHRRAGHRRPRRAADRRVPRPPRTRARQQRPHPQHPAGRDPLAVRATPPCTTPNTPPRIARVLAIPPKRFDRNLVTYLTEPEVDALLAAPDRSTWTGRRDHAMLAARHPDRAADLRTDRPHPRRHRTSAPAPTCTASARAERNATPRSPPPPRACSRPGSTERAGQPARPAVPDPTGATAQPRRHRTPPRPPHRDGRANLPVAQRQASDHAHPAAHRRHAPAPRRRRHHRHRALARPRTDRHHPDLPARRHDPQRTSASPAPRPTRRQARPLPAQPTPSSPSSKRSDYAENQPQHFHPSTQRISPPESA